MCSFFFSSRRRHTRSYGDWSSDVCSSDLPPTLTSSSPVFCISMYSPLSTPGGFGRSEERRVGKECRPGWWWEQEKKKGRTDRSWGEVTQVQRGYALQRHWCIVVRDLHAQS